MAQQHSSLAQTCQDIQSQLLPFVCHRTDLAPKYLKDKQHRLQELCAALTLLWPGVVLAKGVVLRCIWVQEPQGVFRNVFSCHHFVVADDIREGDSRELLLGVWLYRMELGLCRREKQ